MCDTFQGWHRGLTIGRRFMVWTVLTGLCLGGGTATAQFNIQQAQPIVDPAQALPSGYSGSYPLGATPVSYGTSKKKDARPLPYHIAEMPQPEEELEVIHHRSQLIITRSRITRWAIADPSIIDILQYSPTEISVIGLTRGSTHLTIWFEGEPSTKPLIYRVEVIRDPNLEDRRREDFGKLERDIQVLFPNSQVFLIPLSFRVIVKGQARDQEEAAQILQVVRAEWLARGFGGFGNGNGNGYGDAGGGDGGGGGWGGGGWGNNNNNNNNFVINMLEVPGEQQLMIHVRIAQIDRAQLRRFGIDIAGLFNSVSTAGHAIAGTISPASGLSSLSGIFENGEVGILLDWLASNRTAKILAEPSITVLSGEAASFIAGGEFAVPTIVGVGGAQGTTTTFRGFGTSLIVTPTVIDKDLVRMRIVPEFSAINSNNTSGGVPGLDTRRATTTVQLREGQTIALAGLFSHQSSVEVTRIPFLGELPFIGPRLFNAKQANQGETELLFLVTPEIVRPMEQDEVPPVPGHYVTHPNDYELYHYAMTEGAPDEGVYQLAPYGWGPGMGTEIGYRPYNPQLNGPFPPGPPNGIIGGSLQTGGGAYGGNMNGGYGAPMGLPPGATYGPPTGHAPIMQAPPSHGPTPDPSVRRAPNGRNNQLLGRQSAGEIESPSSNRSGWNMFRRNNSGPVQPAGYSAPRGR